ncbi:MAG: F0F1 ATP synthase subunit A [Kiritimatiellaeota bacterium]|nr:F0F1 ATP synthase subunit A [Kiritimatiellota bacterium]
MEQESQEAVQMFINHHALHHAGSSSAWNVPFFRVDALEWFRYDAVMLGVIVLALLGLAVAVRRSRGEVPKGIAAVAEMFVVFVRDSIVYENMGREVGRRYVSFFCTLFIFILCGNLLGLVPLFSTATGCVSVTAGLATVFVFVALGAVAREHGLAGFKGAFVPQGLPVWMTPLMAGMEAVGFFSRAVTLAVRLFCNMLAGHIVIYALLGMVVILGWVALPFLAMSVVMWFFEIFVAFLQAYIFTLLCAISLNMMVNPEH